MYFIIKKIFIKEDKSNIFSNSLLYTRDTLNIIVIEESTKGKI